MSWRDICQVVEWTPERKKFGSFVYSRRDSENGLGFDVAQIELEEPHLTEIEVLHALIALIEQFPVVPLPPKAYERPSVRDRIVDYMIMANSGRGLAQHNIKNGRMYAGASPYDRPFIVAHIDGKYSVNPIPNWLDYGVKYS